MWLLQVLALLQEVLLCRLLRLHPQDVLTVGWGQVDVVAQRGHPGELP